MLRKRDLLWIAGALLLAVLILFTLGQDEEEEPIGEGTVIGDPF